jgi:hypothetical protein
VKRPVEERQFVSAEWIATRWLVSRKTVRRKLRRAGVHAFCLGDSRNDTVRFDLADVLAYETRNQDTASRPGGLPDAGVLAPSSGSFLSLPDGDHNATIHVLPALPDADAPPARRRRC